MVVACWGVLLMSANFNSIGFGSGTPKNPRLHPHFFRNRQRTARKRSKPVWHVLFGTPCWTPLVRSSGGHICILALCTRNFHDSFENVVRLRPGGLVVWGVGFKARGLLVRTAVPDTFFQLNLVARKSPKSASNAHVRGNFHVSSFPGACPP